MLFERCLWLAFKQTGRLAIVPALLVAGAFLFPIKLAAQDTSKPKRPIDGIRDNSFFVEEAYNQEAGVVQHIFNGIYSTTRLPGDDFARFDMAFTQEWPLPDMQHQVSYTIPYSFTDLNGNTKSGVGDLLLNYRYQAYFDEHSLTAFAPRLSVILPAGDGAHGFGEDTVGLQANLPFSTTFGDRWFMHLNAGMTFLPDTASANGNNLEHYTIAASAIYAFTTDFHALVELTGGWIEMPDAFGNLDHEFTAIISPGFRKAFNFDNGSQLVAGLAVPVGLNDNAFDYGVFFYLSFEHAFRRVNNP